MFHQQRHADADHPKVLVLHPTFGWPQERKLQVLLDSANSSKQSQKEPMLVSPGCDSAI